MRKVILVVDDEDEIRELIGDILEARGYKVELAAHGLEALERMEQRRPDLIVLDMMMLHMDGASLMDALDQQDARIPLLVLTASDVAYQSAAKRLGTGSCMMKPVKINELLRRVEQITRNANNVVA